MANLEIHSLEDALDTIQRIADTPLTALEHRRLFWQVLHALKCMTCDQRGSKMSSTC